ncbi:hypothetical protein TBLA_0C01840 [Henningerozyma blattae CBS 6284]|uniref:Pre-mRNA-splicing factor PRP46 n=1 Tax=Henningerozyma blattae (strain ATCC 34711 / CBS 6284 / DSM 70876 / NBRC 10599 / NRRL Y-10934 / UCD 77-7) TaxID=1071380 RepID=I2H0U5_HENB6|nr:hypothetical protein TBLA_0C01840 [Tetrapisispora blattae CBS 6284]CCH59997.1 hypothetical protein TBLA_0C01840 [Tetrapisispora blattae CBS 6284]
MNYDNPGIEDLYVNTRWHNQFRYMDTLPDHLQEKINKSLRLKSAIYPALQQEYRQISSALVTTKSNENNNVETITQFQNQGSVLKRYQTLVSQKPDWHAPWKLMRVIKGHNGWVRCVQIDPVDNEWFATGSNDTTIKIWDLASGKLKITLSGHAMTVRDIAISNRHPYLFSASEDKLAKCWDLEKNTAIRDYHGHLSGVHTVDIHPTLDLIATAGRDSVVKLWDIRSRVPVVTLIGHKSPINKVHCLPVNPQVISSSVDATIRLWDIVAGKASKVLTHHKRSIRDIAFHPSEFSMATACTDDIRSWKLPEGSLLTNFEASKVGIINCLSINQDNVLFAGGDNGALSFYDYKSGHKYQSLETQALPESPDAERSILASTFDQTGLRLITCESDKTIKMWKQDTNSTVETAPGLPWNPTLQSQRF